MDVPKKKYTYSKKMGRPTIYCEELAAFICEKVATNTFGLSKLCAIYDDMPHSDTINVWRYRYPDFSARYAQAKLFQADLLAEEMLDIADDGRNDWMENVTQTQDGSSSVGWKFNSEHVQRSRLRIDTRKFLSEKLLLKQYGSKNDKMSGEKSVIEMLIDKLSE
jgi:hypothetical protein